MIIVTCPSCSHELKLPDNLAGRQGKCPSCQKLIVIPAADAAPPAQQNVPDSTSKPLPPGMSSAPASPAPPAAVPAQQASVQPPVVTPPSSAAPQPIAPVAPAAPAPPPVAVPPVINTQAPQPVQPIAPAAPVINTAPPEQPATPTAASASPFVTPQAGEITPAPEVPAGFPQINTTGNSNASPFPQINTEATGASPPTDPVGAYQARQKGKSKKVLLLGGGLLGIGAVVAILFLFVFTGGGSNSLAGLTREILGEVNSAIGPISSITDAGTAQNAADDLKAIVPTLQDIAKRFKDKVANTSKEDLIKEIEALLDDPSIKNELVSLIKQVLPLQTKLENLPPDAVLALGTAMVELQNSAATLGTDFEQAFSALEAKAPQSDFAPLLPKALNLLTNVMTEVPELSALMDTGIPGLGGGFGGMFGGGDEFEDESVFMDEDGGLMDGGLEEFDEAAPENPFE